MAGSNNLKKIEKKIDMKKPQCYDVLKYPDMLKEIPTMMNLFAAYVYSYFYFFGFGADKVRVLFAANNASVTFA